MQEESDLIPFTPFDPTGKRVLVLAPHPDDETIGCGGALVLHRMAGDPVRVVFLTDGSKGMPDSCISAEQCVRERRKEALAACAVLGVSDVVFWEYEDRKLCDARCSLRRLIEMIETWRPELMYVPSILEFHPDHRMAACLIGDAASSLSGFDDVEIAMYEVNQPVCVNTLVDITRVLERKAAALACYQSQLQVRPYDAVSLALNRFRSLTLGPESAHAEGFFRCTIGEIREKGLYGLSILCIDRYRPSSCEAGPLVSVLIRTKDRPQHLANAIRSVVEQTYRHIEIVLVNDGEADVQALAERSAQGVPLTYIRHASSRGRAAAANAALAAAKGAWLNFLDDDDVLYPDHVETLIRKLQDCGGDAAYAGVVNRYYRSLETVSEGPIREEIHFNHPFDSDVLLFENYLPIMSVLFSKAALMQLDTWFDERLVLFEDWDFWIRLTRGRVFHHVDRITAEYRFYGHGEDATIEAIHRGTYDYDAAKACLFDRAKPWMDGKSWVRFLKAGSYAELIRQREGLRAEVARLRQENQALQQRLQDLAGGCTEASLPDGGGASGLFLKRIAGLWNFDADWYCKQYPDVAKSRWPAFVHYLLYGDREGRQVCDGERVKGD